MRRVVITGLGVVSCLGNNQEEVHQSLVNSKSGISYAKEYKEHNLKCHVHGKPNIKLEDHIDRKTIRFMGSGSAYNYIAMKEAIKDSGLEESEVSNFKTGIVMGSGGPSIENVILAADKTRAKTPKLMGPFIVPRTMASTASATLAVPFKIKGTNYTMSSACSTSGHCIGNSMELIQMGKQDIVFAGGSEEVHWAMTAMFDAMTALTSKYNDTPETASRAYDKTRDGFVIAGGGGVLVLEEYEHAKARGAKIYAELSGYGATSDENIKKLSSNVMDIDEYVVDIANNEGLAEGLEEIDGGVTVHHACHARAQNMGIKARDMLKHIPNVKIDVVERCAGHGGTFGVMKETHDLANKVGRPTARQIKNKNNKYMASDCPLAGKHLKQLEVDTNISNDEALHPIELMAKSYKL